MKRWKVDVDLIEALLVMVPVALIAVALIFVAIRIREESRLDTLPPKVYAFDIGTIASIDRCYVSKRSYKCKITMSTGWSFRADLHDWPDGFLQTGRRMRLEVVTQDYRQKYMFCHEGRCFTGWRAYRGSRSDTFDENYAKGNL